MRSIEVCFTPDLIRQHSLKEKTVVVVDIFRATSCIVTGLAHGVKAIKPIAEIEETLLHGPKGYVMAGERGGVVVEGFDIGNSPFEYQQDYLASRKVAISTTNGSQAVLKSQGASEILVGAFLNLEALAMYLVESKRDILIHCAGWKGTPNLEDSLFAGALIDEVAESLTISGDSALIAHQLFISAHENLLATALKSSHAERLKNFGTEQDLVFCMEESKYAIVPKLIEGELVIPT
ncbi:MAG: 2-phosphosulfolactate phosphatase [Bacteroidota bacterium]